MRWTVGTLNAAVNAEIEALPNDMRARLARLANVIEQIGFSGLPRDSVTHLENRLWELRITGRGGISRAIYVICNGERSSRRNRARLCEEDAEDAPTRT